MPGKSNLSGSGSGIGSGSGNEKGESNLKNAVKMQQSMATNYRGISGERR